MTTHPHAAAIYAFKRLTEHILDYVNDGDWPDGEVGQIDADINLVKTALQNAPQWLPIESAPRDGTRILVCTYDDDVGYRKGSIERVIGFFAKKYSLPCHEDCNHWPDEKLEEFFDYQESSGEWFAKKGFYTNTFENQYGDEIAKAIRPTHWMPLPAAPKGGE